MRPDEKGMEEKEKRGMGDEREGLCFIMLLLTPLCNPLYRSGVNSCARLFMLLLASMCLCWMIS